MGHSKAYDIFERINSLEGEIEETPDKISKAKKEAENQQQYLDSKGYERSLKDFDYDNRRIKLPAFAAAGVVLLLIGIAAGIFFVLAGIVCLILAVKNFVQYKKVSEKTKNENESERIMLLASIENNRMIAEKLAKELPEKKAELERLKSAYPEELGKLKQLAESGDPQACYDLALIESRSGHSAEGLKWLQMAGERGDLNAQRELGKLFESRGAYEDAAKWYMKAADQGDGESQWALYGLSTHEKGISLDNKTDAELLRKAAENGIVDAQAVLGSNLFFGIGGQQDYKLALYWLEKAASKNSPVSAYLAGLIYFQGFGITKDIKKGVSYLEKGAAGGVPNAQAMLVSVYFVGEGPVQPNKEQAYKYFDKVVNNKQAWFPNVKKEEIMPTLYFMCGTNLVKDAITRNVLSDGSLNKYGLKADSDFKKGMSYLEQASNQGVEGATNAIRDFSSLVN